MKRTVIFFLLAAWAVIVASCSRHRLVVNGFVDEPQDSILIDLSQYVFPDSRIEIKDVKKLDGYYYFRFYKPSQEEDDVESENMEYSDTQFPTENEDDVDES